MAANSHCFSADVNAAFDPAYGEVHERRNASYINYGVVVTKYTGARGKAGTNDATAEMMGFARRILDEENVGWQTGELGKAQPGALMMASKVKATIVPACIIGTDYKRHGRIWPKVTVRFGKPMPFPEDAVVNKEFLHAMTEELMQHIAKLQAGEKV